MSFIKAISRTKIFTTIVQLGVFIIRIHQVLAIVLKGTY